MEGYGIGKGRGGLVEGLASFSHGWFDDATTFDAGRASANTLWSAINDSADLLNVGFTNFFASSV